MFPYKAGGTTITKKKSTNKDGKQLNFGKLTIRTKYGLKTVYRNLEGSEVVEFHVPSVRTGRCFWKCANTEDVFSL